MVGAINRRDTCVIQVDLADVDFIDSSAIGALVSGYKSAQANGTTFTITGAHGDVRKVLDIAGVRVCQENGVTRSC